MTPIYRFGLAVCGVVGVSILFAQAQAPAQTAPGGQAPAAAPAPAKTPTPHPLDPLTEDEIKAAVDLLKSEGKHTHCMVYSFIGLAEPPKQAVLAFKDGDPIVRR